MRPFQHQLPDKGNFIDLTLHDIMDITAQLNKLLQTESLLLTDMRMKELAPLQAEKEKLSAKLESFQKLIATDNSIVKTAAENDREELIALTDDLALTIEENLRRTEIAQNVNQRVMRTLMDVMANQQRTGAYGRQGVVQPAVSEAPVSLNLNQSA